MTSEVSEADHHDATMGLFVMLRVVLVRPRLWLIALRTASGLIRSRWWTTSPYLPLPDPRWIGFRLETAYGSPDTSPDVEDIVGYLEWCKMMRKIA